MSGKGCDYEGEDRRESCTFADDAAEKAVQKTFAILGVDINDPKQVNEFQKSLNFGDSMRKFFDKGFLATAVVMAGLFAAIVYAGIKARLGVGGP